MTSKYRVLIADDHDIFREGLRSVLARNTFLDVVGEAAHGREAFEQTLSLKPDLVVLDVAMPELNGIEAARLIMEASPKTKIIILSVHSRKRFILESLKAGAKGYILKDSAGEKLLDAVSAVLKGEYYLDSPVASHIVSEFLAVPGAAAADKLKTRELTDREREVLQLIVEGYSNRQIAEKLCVSSKTVENHRTSMMNKLDRHDVIGLVKYAIATGLVDPDSWSH
ncbi:MAG: response regulator transcription factor [Proteobacteria bacterium]|nr:response regulator transcription factor [Pseudomonadota bacterium]